MTSQDIINAIISYFFLGPILWLAKNNPNFSHPFIQGHARRSSMIFLVTAALWIAFVYLIKPITHFQVGPFFLSDIILFVGVVSFLSILLFHAYLAYKGKDVSSIHSEWMHIGNETSEQKVQLTDREKLLVVFSFIPYLGIYIYSKYPNSMTRRGEASGTCIALFITITSIVFHTGYSIGLLTTLLYIVLVVTVAVKLFIEDSWLEISFMKYIPGILEIGTYTKCFFLFIEKVFLVVFGKESSLSWNKLLEEEEEKQGKTNTQASVPYIFPASLIGIPGINLITLPSFFMAKYSEWKFAILQGFIITLITIYIVYMYSSASSYLGLILFPAIVLMSYLPITPYKEAPVVSLIAHMINFLTFHTLTGKEKLQQMKTNTESVGFVYQEK